MRPTEASGSCLVGGPPLPLSCLPLLEKEEGSRPEKEIIIIKVEEKRLTFSKLNSSCKGGRVDQDWVQAEGI